MLHMYWRLTPSMVRLALMTHLTLISLSAHHSSSPNTCYMFDFALSLHHRISCPSHLQLPSTIVHTAEKTNGVALIKAFVWCGLTSDSSNRLRISLLRPVDESCAQEVDEPTDRLVHNIGLLDSSWCVCILYSGMARHIHSSLLGF